MVQMRIVYNQSELPIGRNWTGVASGPTSEKFIDSQGRTVSASHLGRKYKVISEKERRFSVPERIARGILGGLATAVTFGLSYFLSSRVRHLFHKTERVALATRFVDKSGWDFLKTVTTTNIDEKLLIEGSAGSQHFEKLPKNPMPGTVWFSPLQKHGEKEYRRFCYRSKTSMGESTIGIVNGKIKDTYGGSFDTLEEFCRAVCENFRESDGFFMLRKDGSPLYVELS